MFLGIQMKLSLLIPNIFKFPVTNPLKRYNSTCAIPSSTGGRTRDAWFMTFLEKLLNPMYLKWEQA